MVLSRRSFLLRSGVTAAGLIGCRSWGERLHAKALSGDTIEASIDSISIPLRDWSGFTVFGESAVVLAPRTEAEVVEIRIVVNTSSMSCCRSEHPEHGWYGDDDTDKENRHLDALA